MPVEIKIPSVGESVTEGILARWLKKDGDFVRRDEPVLELESDKATSEVSAPAAGKLSTKAKEGATVAIGAVVGTIDDSLQAPAQASVAAPIQAAAAIREPIASPSAIAHAKSEGVDLQRITGSGKGGRIIKEDVLASAVKPIANGAPAAVTTPAVPATGRETRQRMSGLRQRIATRLLESQQTTASLTTFNEADMTAINGLRALYKDKFKEKYGVNLGFTSFFVKAVVEALKAFPQVNARIDGSDVVYHHFHDIGVAVSTDKGLMVPVLRDADRLGFAAIEKTVAELAVRARDGKIAPADLQGGTFTITNGGVFGSLMSTPILNPPQCAILGMHAIQKRPIAVNDQVVIRPMMYLALTYDHRLIDGREAVQFLVKVKEGVEQPERLLLEL